MGWVGDSGSENPDAAPPTPTHRRLTIRNNQDLGAGGGDGGVAGSLGICSRRKGSKRDEEPHREWANESLQRGNGVRVVCVGDTRGSSEDALLFGGLWFNE